MTSPASPKRRDAQSAPQKKPSARRSLSQREGQTSHSLNNKEWLATGEQKSGGDRTSSCGGTACVRWEGESWRPRIENSDVIMNDIISKFAVSLLTAFPSLLHLSQKLPRLQYALVDIYEEDAEEESPGPRPILYLKPFSSSCVPWS